MRSKAERSPLRSCCQRLSTETASSSNLATRGSRTSDRKNRLAARGWSFRYACRCRRKGHADVVVPSLLAGGGRQRSFADEHAGGAGVVERGPEERGQHLLVARQLEDREGFLVALPSGLLDRLEIVRRDEPKGLAAEQM